MQCPWNNNNNENPKSEVSPAVLMQPQLMLIGILAAGGMQTWTPSAEHSLNSFLN